MHLQHNLHLRQTHIILYVCRALTGAFTMLRTFSLLLLRFVFKQHDYYENFMDNNVIFGVQIREHLQCVAVRSIVRSIVCSFVQHFSECGHTKTFRFFNVVIALFKVKL